MKDCGTFSVFCIDRDIRIKLTTGQGFASASILHRCKMTDAFLGS